MEPTTTNDEQDSCGFDLVLKELIEFRDESNQSTGSNRFERVLRQLMAEREKAAIAADRNRQQSELMAEREKAAVATAILKQHEELMAEREKAAVATALLKQQTELMAEREKAAVATALLKQHEETARVFSKQQNDFHQLRLQKQQEEFRAKLEEEMRLHNLKKDKLIARQDQERRSALEQQGRQHMFFREVLQQLQEEVKVLRHSESGKSSVSRASYIEISRPDDANRFHSSFDSIHSRRK